MDDSMVPARSTGRSGGGRPARSRSYTSSFEVLAGSDVVERLGADLDDLAAAAGTPVTGRTTWLRSWVDAHAPAEPWAVTVRERFSARLDGVALFSSRPADGHEAIFPLGRRQLDRGALPVRNPEAADALAAAVANALRSRRGRWALRLGQLPAGDPVARGLTRLLEGAHMVPGMPIPKVELAPGTTMEALLGKNLRKQLRKAGNRLVDDGVDAVVAFDSDPTVVRALLEEVEHTHRAREADARRTSELSSRSGSRFWRGVIVEHALRDELEVATLRLGGELAAYVVSFLDHDTYRVFDGRCATAWGRYSPGRLLEAAAVERALDRPGCARVDWMNGCASEKLLVANAADSTEHLVACSPGLVVDLEVLSRAPATPVDPTVVTLASGAR